MCHTYRILTTYFTIGILYDRALFTLNQSWKTVRNKICVMRLNHFQTLLLLLTVTICAPAGEAASSRLAAFSCHPLPNSLHIPFLLFLCLSTSLPPLSLPFYVLLLLHAKWSFFLLYVHTVRLTLGESWNNTFSPVHSLMIYT